MILRPMTREEYRTSLEHIKQRGVLVDPEQTYEEYLKWCADNTEPPHIAGMSELDDGLHQLLESLTVNDSKN